MESCNLRHLLHFTVAGDTASLDWLVDHDITGARRTYVAGAELNPAVRAAYCVVDMVELCNKNSTLEAPGVYYAADIAP